MIHAKIAVDGKWYGGESAETYDTNIGGEGWHVPNHHKINRLIFNDEGGKEIVGMRNLKSHIGKIIQRIQDDQIVANEIRVIINER